MKTVTMRDLNRKTASILDAVESGECFELRRNGKAVGYLTSTPPPPERKPDWKSHFDRIRKRSLKSDVKILKDFSEERRRQNARERAMDNLK